MRFINLIALLPCLLMISCTKSEQQLKKELYPIRLSTYQGTATSSTHLLQIHSPWNTEEYLSINFPEHCWGAGLPNVSHDSPVPIPSPWSFNADSTWASFEKSTRPGVLFRAVAGVYPMGVRLSLEITNQSDTAITDIRTLICLRPDRMVAFRDTNYAMTYVAVNSKAVQLGAETHYQGEMPDKRKVSWALNVKGGPDNLTLSDLGWFKPGTGPGRIVEELANPPLIAIHARDDLNKWIATIWYPARMLFSNPQIPCIHSDPLPPDCPAQGGSSRAEGIVIFHEGDFASLLERARKELGLK